MTTRRRQFLKRLLGGVVGFGLMATVTARGEEVVGAIGHESLTFEALTKDHQSEVYELEKQKYDLLAELARERYLTYFWTTLANASNITPGAARQAYLEKYADVPESEIKEALARLQDHPSLKNLTPTERRNRVVEYLTGVKARRVVERIVADAIDSKKLVISYPKPREPVVKIAVTPRDHVRYGSKPSEVEPLACAGNDCPLTIVEYTDFQCHRCRRALANVRQLLDDYRGKIRWVTRDFPLALHPRARSAATAAHCAGEQGRYWEMYETLLERGLPAEGPESKGFAEKAGIDPEQFAQCLKSPGAQSSRIDADVASGRELGVVDPPTYFVNGRRLSGETSYEEFLRVFDEELSRSRSVN